MIPTRFRQIFQTVFSFLFLLSCSAVLQNCSGDDPKEEPNEKETINGVNITIWAPGSGGIEPYYDLILTDDDEDGTFEPDEAYPTITFPTNTTFEVYTSFFDKHTEIENEKDDHLLCFVATNGVVDVDYKDEDSNSLPLGISTEWVTGANEASGQLTISLQHQPGTKTGNCPGSGVVDFELVIPVEVEK